jgi:hypothetical protein
MMIGTARVIRCIRPVVFILSALIGSGCGSGGGTAEFANVGGGSCSRDKTCPIADAGPDQTVVVGTKVTLDGSNSSSGTTGLITYQWTLTSQPIGSIAVLTAANTVSPTFTPDGAGDYAVKLVVDNAGLLSKSDTVIISAGTGNLPPTADAGPDQTVPPGTIVTLDGSRSHDPNGASVTFAWTFKKQPPKSQSSLDNPTSATPSFKADVEGTYKLNLTVSDGILTSSTDQAEITVTAGNIAPVADAGPDQQVTTGQLVTLTGADSTDANGDPLTYNWRFQSVPAGSTATLTDPNSVTPNFTPDFAGFYVLSLVVNDGQVTSSIDTLVIDAHLPGFVNLVLQSYVKASNTQASSGSGINDNFGVRVAVSGDTLAVSATGEDSCATGINGDQTNNGCSSAGAVYVFTRTNGVWSQQAYLKASNTETIDFFGESIALDAETLAVGAHSEDSCATGINGDQTNNDCPEAGAVYVFTRTNGVWSQQAYVKASNTEAVDFFGSTVALSGNTLGVGADSEASCATGINGDQTNNDCVRAGAVYVFTRTNGVWSQQAYVKASNTGAEDRFGLRKIALSGDTLAVAALVEASCATGINGDQTNNGCFGAGAVYVFTRTNSVWSQQAYVKASNTANGDFFGQSVALVGDTLAVGASDEDSCATGVNGDQSNNGCSGAGAVYVFTRSNGVWSQQAYVKASNTGANDHFFPLALGDETLAVGAEPEDSCATGVNGDQSNNGCSGAGAVYVFTRSNGVWSQQAYVKASNTGVGDVFGTSVAISGNTLAVGAHNEDSCATGTGGDQSNNGCDNAGAAYVYAGQ